MIPSSYCFCLLSAYCVYFVHDASQYICSTSHYGTNVFILWSYLQWWHAWSSQALAACKPPWLPLWSSLCCTLCPTWSQPEPPPGPHNCSGRPLSGSAEMPCWESVKVHTSCPLNCLGWNLTCSLAVETVLLKQQFWLVFSRRGERQRGFQMRSPLGFSDEWLLSLIRNFMWVCFGLPTQQRPKRYCVLPCRKRNIYSIWNL